MQLLRDISIIGVFSHWLLQPLQKLTSFSGCSIVSYRITSFFGHCGHTSFYSTDNIFSYGCSDISDLVVGRLVDVFDVAWFSLL
jgi:hypothetical protein